MLRFLRERRAWLAAAFVVLVLVTGLWVWGVPRAAARMADALGDRFGVDVNVDDTSLGFRTLRLRGVEVRGRHGGLLVRVDEVDAKMSVIGALFDGAGSVRRLSARGVDATIDLEHEDVAELIAKLGRRLASRSNASRKGSSEARQSRGRAYDVSDLTIRVADADGPLLFMRNLSFVKEADDLRSQVEETMVGERGADHAHIGAWKIAFERDAGSWRLKTLDLDGASVRSVSNGDGAKKALALRIRDAIALARPEEPSTTLEPSDETEGSEIGNGNEPDVTPASARLFARLSPEASVVVREVQLESRTSAEHVERVQHGEVTLDGKGDGWFRVVVAGETSNRATLNVDLSVMPEEARAEGSVELRRISLALIAPFVPELPLYDTEAGTVSAALDLEASASGVVAIEGGFKLRELALSSERIAPGPVEHINLDVRGRGVWHPDERRLEIERGQVRMGKARVLVDGELERTPEHYRADLTLRLPPTRCNDVVGAIPADILGSLSRFEWSGNWSALTRISLDSRELEATELSIRVRNLCQFEQTPNWVRIERFQEPFTHRAVEPDETVFKMRTGPGTDNWVAFADISPFVVPAVISHEDGGFYDHAGFAPWAIRDALVRNLQEGRYVVGASTISMQLAKNLYLQREKTIARKVQEVLLTWWLENALTKDEILELYLNVIEYGPSVYGLRQAAAYYFGRQPQDLSPAESAYLACMLPSPKRYHVSYERDALTRSMRSRSRRLLEHMAKRERIGPEALAYGLAELEDFQFWHEGDPPPEPRVLPPVGVPELLDPETEDPFEALFLGP
jgi:hypothetical protein